MAADCIFYLHLLFLHIKHAQQPLRLKLKGYKNITTAFIACKFNIIARLFQQQWLLGLIYLGRIERKTETGMMPAACSGACVCVFVCAVALVQSCFLVCVCKHIL